MNKINLIIGFLTLLLITNNTFGQSKQNLKKELWKRAQTCYDSFEDNDDDGELDDAKIIEDIKNGYLQVSGAIGTCGCNCSKTIASFKDKNNNFTFINQEISDCNWLHKVSSNRKMVDILPKNFGVQTFIPMLKDTLSKKAVFYLDFDIPQYGTDMKVSLKLIPFGMNIKNKGLLVYNISENREEAQLEELISIPKIISKLNTKSISMILNCKEINLPKNDLNLIATQLNKNEQQFTLSTFGKKVRELKKTYDLYNSIKHQTVILKWNKSKAKFYISKKEEAVKVVTFEEFLNNEIILKFWMAIC